EKAKNVIDQYSYELVKPYGELWDIDNQENSEVIFSVQYSTNPVINGEGNRSHVFFVFAYQSNPTMVRDLPNGVAHNRFMVTNYLINLFDVTSDSRWEGSFKTVWFANQSGSINGHNVSPGDTAIKIVPYPVPDE